MRKYAPRVKLDARQLGGRNTGAWYDPDKEPPEIKWPIVDGLTVLMHEIGHYRMKHVGPDVMEKELWEEVTAWLWAEKECHKLGIMFDYALAEHYFNVKDWNKKRPLVMINWRHRNGD